MLLSLWRNIHLALALSCSVVLIILSVTGVVLSLEPIQHRASSLHIGSAADRSLGDFIAELQEKYIEIIEVKIDDEQRIQLSAINEEGDYIESYIDGNTLEVLGDSDELHWIFSFAKKLHRSLFIGEVGRAIVGIISGLFVLLIISGIILLVKRQLGFRNFFAPITKDNAFRYWHTMISRYATPVVLVIGLTGGFLSLERFGLVLNETNTQEDPTIAVKEPYAQLPVSSFVSLKEIRLGQLKSLLFPFSPEPEDCYIIDLDDQLLYVNQFNGAIEYQQSSSKNEQIKGYLFTIHTGGVGILWPIILLLGSLSILFLIVSGFLAFVNRKKKKYKNTVRQSEANYALFVGSASGSTFKFAEQLQQALFDVGKQAYIAPLNEFRIVEGQEIVILTSTHGDGEAPDNAKDFLDRIRKTPPKQQFKYSIVGFGSYAYPKFCQFAIDVEEALSHLPAAQARLALHKIHGAAQATFEQWVNLWSTKHNLSLQLKTKEQQYQSYKVIKNQLNETTFGETFIMEFDQEAHQTFKSGDLLAIRPSVDVAERYYSIGKVNNRIVLSVKRHDQGLCSNFLLKQGVGMRIEGRIVRNISFRYTRTRRNTLFIANGTGIAPFLGMIRESRRKDKVHLIWGAANKEAYEPYKPYIEEAGIPKENIHFAYSREENRPKQYVQDVLRMNRQLLFSTLASDGQIMICGSISMQNDVFVEIDKCCLSPKLKTRDYYQRRGNIATDCY